MSIKPKEVLRLLVCRSSLQLFQDADHQCC